MSAFDWSTNAGLNAIADEAMPVPDGVSARVYASLVRGLMAGVAQFIADTSGALVSVGLTDLYAVNTFSGLKPKPGTMIAFWAHRTNEAEPSLMVDGYGPVAFLAADGNELAPGTVVQGQLQMVVWDEAVSPEKPAWRKINPAATDLQVLNAATAMEALAALLPKEAPDGAGKLWYNNGIFQVTTGAQS